MKRTTQTLRRIVAFSALAVLRRRDREILIRAFILNQPGGEVCQAMSLHPAHFRLLKSRAKFDLYSTVGAIAI
ncbi:MAG TPA: hypothetical protein VN736_02485 [Candidatus Limnocylindrales bacterium]|nr:hypothetical protein [Candidatus Limnocylindrales bacterium]